MKKDDLNMGVLLLFSLSTLMAGSIATITKWLCSKGNATQDYSNLMLSLVGLLGMGVWASLQSTRQRILRLEDALKSKP